MVTDIQQTSGDAGRTVAAPTLSPIDVGSIEPVFVVGMNGSGTTMLLDCLGHHPSLYGFPVETRTLPDILARLGGELDDDKRFRKLWDALAAVPAFAVMNHDVKPPVPVDWRDYPRQASAVVDYFFRYFALDHGKSRWLEKTPQHAQHIELLAAHFPGAKFIHMIRDGRDCAVSFERRWKRTPELTVYRWKNVVRLCREQGQRLGSERYLELHYEVLTEEPQRWMKQVCEFVGVDYDPVVLTSRLPEHASQAQTGTIMAQSARWRKAFTARKTMKLEAIGGGLLRELGYAVDNAAGDEDPAVNKLRYWRAVDYLRQYANEIKEKLQGKSAKSWHFILRLPFLALSQTRSQRF